LVLRVNIDDFLMFVWEHLS